MSSTSSASDESNLRIEKLNSENYYNWKFDVKMLLVGKDLWDIVTGEEIVDDEMPERDRASYKKRDNKALSVICLALSNNLKIYVRNAKSAQEAWNSLANHFEEKTLSRKIEFRKKLYEARMGNSTMVEHVNNLRTISEHLEALEDGVLEKDLVMILLSSLPPEYNNLITTLETLKEERLTWEYVRDRVLTEYERKKDPYKPKDGTEALFVGGGGNSKNSPQGKNYQDNRKRTSKFPCHYCGEIGHFQRDCEAKKNDVLEKENKLNEELEKVRKRMEELEKESAAFCSTSIDTSTRDKEHFDDFVPEFALHVGDLQEIKYLLDSGCSRHITGNKHDLANYNDFDEEDNDESHMVTLADKSIVKAVGKGNLNVHLKDSKGEKVPVTFKDVLYIPKMKRLISVGQLTQAGGEVTFKEKSAVLRVSGRSFVFGTKVGKLYNMNWCYFATTVENTVKRTEEIKKEINEKTETDSEPVGVITEENEERNNEFEGVKEVKFSVDEDEHEEQSLCARKKSRARSDAIRVDDAVRLGLDAIGCADAIRTNADLPDAHVNATRDDENLLSLNSWGCSFRYLRKRYRYTAVEQGFQQC